MWCPQSSHLVLSIYLGACTWALLVCLVERCLLTDCCCWAPGDVMAANVLDTWRWGGVLSQWSRTTVVQPAHSIAATINPSCWLAHQPSSCFSLQFELGDVALGGSSQRLEGNKAQSTWSSGVCCAWPSKILAVQNLHKKKEKMRESLKQIYNKTTSTMSTFIPCIKMKLTIFTAPAML